MLFKISSLFLGDSAFITIDEYKKKIYSRYLFY